MSSSIDGRRRSAKQQCQAKRALELNYKFGVAEVEGTWLIDHGIVEGSEQNLECETCRDDFIGRQCPAAARGEPFDEVVGGEMAVQTDRLPDSRVLHPLANCGSNESSLVAKARCGRHDQSADQTIVVEIPKQCERGRPGPAHIVGDECAEERALVAKPAASAISATDIESKSRFAISTCPALSSRSRVRPPRSCLTGRTPSGASCSARWT